MRLAAAPWIALAVILLAVTVAVFIAPRVERLQELTVPTVRPRLRLRPWARDVAVAVLVMVDAKRDDRRRRARRNGKLTRAELEAVASVEMDREARQV